MSDKTSSNVEKAESSNPLASNPSRSVATAVRARSASGRPSEAGPARSAKARSRARSTKAGSFGKPANIATSSAASAPNTTCHRREQPASQASGEMTRSSMSRASMRRAAISSTLPTVPRRNA